MKASVKMAQSIVGTSKGRPEHDFYPTPSYAIEALLDVESFYGRVWECACGDGAISKILEQHGYTVFSSDLYDYGFGNPNYDFLTSSILECPNIVTNPPFRLIEHFISHAKTLGVYKMALLAKLTLLEGQKRSRLLEESKLSRVHVFRKRLTMTRNGEPLRNGGMIAFAWYVWEKNYEGKPIIGWI